MNTCFICQHLMVPDTPAACQSTVLRRAYEVIQNVGGKGQPVKVADYEIRLFERQKVCLIKELCNPQQPKISLTNSIETAIVQIGSQYGLCPSRWTFVEYANSGEGKNGYHEYDMIVLSADGMDWKYLWHSERLP